MTNYVERCLIVPAGYAPMARALCNGLAPGGSGSGMFTTAVSAAGTGQASHYISAGMIEQAFAALLPLTRFDADGAPTTAPGQPETVTTLAQGQVTLAQVNALLAAIDVTEQDPFTALARLGLKPITEESA